MEEKNSMYTYIGCDEAGRGPLAGPVIAAAIVLPEVWLGPPLRDSKVLNERQRQELRKYIENYAVAWAIGEASVEEIDTHNILQASFLAMHRAIAQIPLLGDPHLLIDGNSFKPYEEIPHTCIVQGDAKIPAIAAASILAKTHRDRVMHKLSEKFPMYGWEQNKGYPTQQHKQAILAYGICKHHRRSFKHT